jgi:hypothetical protein
MQNSTFLKSSFNLNGTFVQMLHFQPNFTRKPVSIRYEISGTDGLVHEGELKISESNSKKQIITFECKLDETYFCKVTGYFNEAKNAMQTIRLFYKVENDMDDVVVKSDSQKFGFKKVYEKDDDAELSEDEEEEDEEDEEIEEPEENDKEDYENMTLEMRVKQLQQFSDYFCEE